MSLLPVRKNRWPDNNYPHEEGHMPKKVLSIAEVSRLSSVAPHRIHYAIRRGFLKEPAQLNGRRCFTPGDLDRIREHFGIRVLTGSDHNAGVITP